MYAIEEGLKKINGQEVATFSREILDGNACLQVEAGTTGYRGACRNAGGRTYLSIDCVCGDFCFQPITDDDGNKVGVVIAACGDDGLNALMKALEFAYASINDQRCDVDD